MKRFVLMLCCLMAAWSCLQEGSYYVSNCQDIVTLFDGQLVNDYGVVYNIQSVASDKVPVPSVSGRRYFLQFDILNTNRDILLKDATDVLTLTVVPAEEPAPAFHDPVNVALYSISPYYLNLVLTYYRIKGSDYAHRFKAEYEKEEGTDYINFLLYHDGNDENPATVEDISTLEQDFQVLSLPLRQDEWTPSGVRLTCHILQQNEEGAWEIIQTKY